MQTTGNRNRGERLHPRALEVEHVSTSPKDIPALAEPGRSPRTHRSKENKKSGGVSPDGATYMNLLSSCWMPCILRLFQYESPRQQHNHVQLRHVHRRLLTRTHVTVNSTGGFTFMLTSRSGEIVDLLLEVNSTWLVLCRPYMQLNIGFSCTVLTRSAAAENGPTSEMVEYATSSTRPPGVGIAKTLRRYFWRRWCH